MKKIFFLFAIFILIITASGCQNSNSEVESDSAPFAEGKWAFYNEVIGEYDNISFGEDNSFSYHCDCGEPVGDSDCYDHYRYNEDELVITLYNEDDNSEKEIKLLSYNVNHLLLEIDGVIRDFSTERYEHDSNFWSLEGESYLSGYEMNRTLLEFTQNGIMTAAAGYDTETGIPKGTLEEYPLAGDAVFFELSLSSKWEVEEDVANEESYDVSFTELGREELEYYFKNGGAAAYLWLNEELEIEKAVFWGVTSVYE